MSYPLNLMIIKSISNRFANNIFAATLRGEADFILAGNSVARVIKQLKPDFVPAAGLSVKGKPATGPRVIGSLSERLVIQDPFMTHTRYVMGHKGADLLMGGFAYCPYIPLFASPTLVTSDLYAQKGFLSSAGFKVINPALFTYGDIEGDYFVTG